MIRRIAEWVITFSYWAGETTVILMGIGAVIVTIALAEFIFRWF